MMHLNSTSTQHTAHSAPVQPGADERRVDQYSPAWIALMMVGADVRDGNVVTVTESVESAVDALVKVNNGLAALVRGE